MTLWRWWIVGQVDATIVCAIILVTAHLMRHRLSPALRSVILLIALVRLALPPFIRSPWSEAAVDLPPVDDTRMLMSGVLQDDRAQYVFAFTTLITLILLARLAWQMLSSRRQLIAATTPAPAAIIARARELAGGDADVEVRLSPEGAGPLAAGFRQPLIVLPASVIDQLDAHALDAALAHEIAHHAKRDLVWIAAARILTAIAWFNPIAHLIARALVACREDGSDDWALARTSNDAFTYAQSLLKSARLVALGGAGVLAAGAHPMGSRMRRLLDQHASRDRRIGVIGATVILIVATLAIPGAHMPTPGGADGRIVIVIRH